jgi:5-formyltetrahydrofolate cyclo-ligase
VLSFSRYQHDQALVKGRYGIWVPAIEDWVQPDVVLIPCVAFHRCGARLGYGAGWYDKTLAAMSRPVLTVGVALADTEVQALFAEPHDRLLDYVVTERELIAVRGG